MATPSFWPVTAVLIDLDGTLVDSVADIGTALNGVLVAEGLPPLGLPEVKLLVGDGAAVLIDRAFAGGGKPTPKDALDRFRARYDECCLESTRTFDGMDELVRDLAERAPVAVVTNKPTAFSRKIIEGIGLMACIKAVVGPELVTERKPSAAHVLGALEMLGRTPEGAVMIGDSEHDVHAGRAAGVKTIAVTWGCRSEPALRAASPKVLVRTVSELRDVLLRDAPESSASGRLKGVVR